LAGRKLHVHDRSDDLNHFSCTHEFTPFAQVLSPECSVLREDDDETQHSIPNTQN
jgi:hypothetical protein